MGSDHTYRVLVVDDDPENGESHSEIVRSLGYEVESAPDGMAALGMLPRGFDFVLVAAEMSDLDGFEVARRIRESPNNGYLPIVIVTASAGPEDRRRALEIGINDFIEKPVDAQELRLRAKWLLQMKTAFDLLENQSSELDRTVDDQTAALKSALADVIRAQRRTHEAHLDTIRRLTIAAEYKDLHTAAHIERIGLYAEVVARQLGFSPDDVDLVRWAAPMHDVGKLGVPERILLKPGMLDENEWKVMRSHTTMGAAILANSDSPVLQLGEKIALSHHEKWDGTGYPNGLAGEDIAIEGRICAVVDFFDALTMERPYRESTPNDVVLEMMKAAARAHFDPDVLDAFLGALPDIVAIQQTYR